MSYYGAMGPPGAFGAPPGQSSSPPGMAPGMPPGMAPGFTPGFNPGMGPGFGPGMAPGMAPGMGGPPGAAPGLNQGQHPLPARPGALPAHFQVPTNMPKFDMNASVIRLGHSASQKMDGIGGRGGIAEPAGQRRGLGANPTNLEQQRQQMRDNLLSSLPPKSDEIAKTIFVANITEGCGGNPGIENLLTCAGGLRKWIRVEDANHKPCTFGFAEYESSESIEIAAEIFKEIYVPLRKQQPSSAEQPNGDNDEKESGIEKSPLHVIIDKASIEYAKNWREQRGESEDVLQIRIKSAQTSLETALGRLFSPIETQDIDGEATINEQTQDPITGEVITIPISQGEDELSDIPPEMRETVAAEIAAFRDRSIRRDMERLKREEEFEARERGAHKATLASSGGTGGANSVPVGPRGPQTVPAGPRGLRGVQIPSDYQNGVTFVRGSRELAAYLGKDDEADTDASDEELERRRQQKKKDEQEKIYNDYERRWLNRERTRSAALEREKNRDENEARLASERKNEMRKKLHEWDDDVEAARRSHEYYIDRAMWAKKRAAFRSREAHADEADRRDEELEKNAGEEADAQLRGRVDAFLDQQATELSAKGLMAPARPKFKISLGAAAKKVNEVNNPIQRAAADAENMLDLGQKDNEDEDAKSEHKKPRLKFDTIGEVSALSAEERQEALQQLATSIPHDADELYGWTIDWDAFEKYPTVEQSLRAFVEKRSMEYLGMVEDLVWDVVIDTLKKRKGPFGLVDELGELLEDETEQFVRKLWRMVVFYSESAMRGLQAAAE